MKKLLLSIFVVSTIMVTPVSVVACSKKDDTINNLPKGETKDLSKIENIQVEINVNKNEIEILKLILTNFKFKGISFDDVKFKDKSFIKPSIKGNELINGQVVVEASGNNLKVIGQTSTIELIALPPLIDIEKINGLELYLVDVEGSKTDVVIRKFLEINKNKFYKSTLTQDFTISLPDDLTIYEYNDIDKQGSGKAKIKASYNSKLYYGSVDVEFSIIAKKDLGAMGLNKDVGPVKNNTLYEVGHEFFLKNQDKLKNNEGFDYKRDDDDKPIVDEYSAIIVGGENELYGGEIEVNFEVIPSEINLKRHPFFKHL